MTIQINMTQAIIEAEDRYGSGVYPKRQVVIVRGEGALVWDADGRQYIDCVAGQGAGLLGHANPAIVAAVQTQAATLMSCPEIFYNDRRAELLERLTALAPMQPARAFLCNSGAEANEAALKAARLITGRSEVVATMRGFHGRTMGALSATWEKKYRAPFAPLLPGFSHIPYNDLESAARAITPTTGAVLVEAIQGEGGVRLAAPGYLEGLRRLCDDAGALLIVDEVQTGIGRTGRFWAVEYSGVVPDILTTAKALGGGMPIGAAIFGERVGALPKGSHGSTFGGNPLACAAALAALDDIRDHDLVARAAELGDYLQSGLRRAVWGGDVPASDSLVREIRGRGLMVGLELKRKVQPYLVALMDAGVLALPAGANVLRLLPSFAITRDQLDIVVATIADVLRREVSGGEGEE